MTKQGSSWGTCICPVRITYTKVSRIFFISYWVFSNILQKHLHKVCVGFSLYPAGCNYFNKIGSFCCQMLDVCQVG